MKKNNSWLFILLIPPLLTLVTSILKIKIGGSLQIFLSVLNILSIVTTFLCSIYLIKKMKNKNLWTLSALAVSSLFIINMFMILLIIPIKNNL